MSFSRFTRQIHSLLQHPAQPSKRIPHRQFSLVSNKVTPRNPSLSGYAPIRTRIPSTRPSTRATHAHRRAFSSTVPPTQPEQAAANASANAASSTTTTSSTSQTAMQIFKTIDRRLVGVFLHLRNLNTKFIILSIVLLSVYMYMQYVAKKKARAMIREKYINMEETQARELASVFNLSATDLAHIAQLCIPHLTSTGLLPLDKVCVAVFDEMNDTKDDRLVAEDTQGKLYTYFSEQSHLQLVQLDIQQNILPQIGYLQAKLQEAIPTVIFDPTTLSISNMPDVTHDPHASTLQAYALRRKELQNEISGLVKAEMEAFAQNDMPEQIRQQQIMAIKTQLSAAQDEVQHIDQNVQAVEQQRMLDLTSSVSPEIDLARQYTQLIQQLHEKQRESTQHAANMESVKKDMPDATRQKLEKFNTFSDSSQGRTPVTPVVEDLYAYNYDTNNDVEISSWTALVLFRNLPSGYAGSTRYVKFSDVLTALALIAKTKFSPASEEHPNYIDRDALKKYRLNMQEVFRDYSNDPCCTGNSIPKMPDEMPPPSSDINDKKVKETLNAARYAKIYEHETDRKFKEIYSLPLEERLAVIGVLFERYGGNWKEVPNELKAQIAERLEILRFREVNVHSKPRLDCNPRQRLILAWASMFAPNPLPNKPEAKSQFLQAIGNYEKQMTIARHGLDAVSKQSLTRNQFEKLLRSMATSGHFDIDGALMKRTNFIWPIAFHSANIKALAQAYYDALNKEPNENITLDEFDTAARYWGKLGKNQLWYYNSSEYGIQEGAFTAYRQGMEYRLQRWAYNLDIADTLGITTPPHLLLQSRAAQDAHKQESRPVKDLENQRKFALWLRKPVSELNVISKKSQRTTASTIAPTVVAGLVEDIIEDVTTTETIPVVTAVDTTTISE